MRPRHVARFLAAAAACLACAVWMESPLRPSATRRLQMLAVAPQWWGYFSQPRQDRTQVFRRAGDTWVQADAPLGAASNLFGLRRAPVHHSAELRTLIAQLGGPWHEAELAPADFPPDPGAPVEVRNLAASPRLCGDVLLLARTPTPWAWARSASPVALPARFVRLKVTC